ncbi:hypothetical protein CAMSH0001_1313 [Campylobacter showae RM3277]|uniref:Uncharacterized protein n=1 Tax=Campylobacter showae RM3277 TaxID=553219 RepID=C6RIG7_9BACT|nr:hypothetical protein CAMSH0001_1313 [Campylobacter showae RM3277]
MRAPSLSNLQVAAIPLSPVYATETRPFTALAQIYVKFNPLARI